MILKSQGEHADKQHITQLKMLKKKVNFVDIFFLPNFAEQKQIVRKKIDKSSKIRRLIQIEIPKKYEQCN